jgi:hypothetical protein
MKKSAKITTKELEERFDKGEDVLEFFDTEKATVEDPKTQRVNVDFPEWMVRRLDDVATRLGIPRQSLIKLYISEAISPRRLRYHAPRIPWASDILTGVYTAEDLEDKLDIAFDSIGRVKQAAIRAKLQEAITR